MKFVSYFWTIIFFLPLTSVGFADHPLDREIQLTGQGQNLATCLNAVLQNSPYALIIEGTEQLPTQQYKITNTTLRELLDKISGKEFRWELKNDVVIIRHIKKETLPNKMYDLLADCSKYANVENGANAYLDSLWKYRLISFGVATKLNNIPQNGNYSNFIDLLSDLVRGTDSLTIIYQLTDEDSQKLYSLIKTNPDFDYSQIKDSSLPLWGVRVSQSYPKTYQVPIPLYIGETVLDGNELLKCRLTLESAGGKGFHIWLKNVSSHPLEFKDFRKENLLLNDVASDGEYFEAREVGIYYIYPPTASDVPENFTLAPGEEKEFYFSMIGSRFRRGHGLKIFEAKVEETLNFKPTEVEVMKKTNRNYNWYSVVVYFYFDGKKYKAFNRDFVDSANFPKP